MKKIKLVLFLCCGILIISCQQEEILCNNEKSIQTVVTNDDVIISSKTAELVGATFRKKSARNVDSRSVFDISVKSFAAINDENGHPVMYIINYADNSGFVIVSATRNYYPILAFSEKGNLEINEIDALEGLSQWVDDGKTIISHYIGEQCQDSIARFRKMWKMYEKPNSSIQTRSIWLAQSDDIRDYRYEFYEYHENYNTAIYQSIQKWMREGISYQQLDFNDESIPQEIRSTGMGMTLNYNPSTAFLLTESQVIPSGTTTPLISTEWGQRYPFNLLTPNNYPAGCVTIAMAQVMNYHQWPTMYDWGNMKNVYDYGETEASKNAAAILAYDVGLSIDIKYGSDRSSADTKDVPSALVNKFQYSSNARFSDYDLSTVCQNISVKRPVIICGKRDQILGLFPINGHAWVCDGWVTPHRMGVTIGDGEYRDYKYDRKMVTNIYPNK